MLTPFWKNYISRGKEMKFPFKQAVLDGGCIIELLLSGVESELFKNISDEKLIPSTTTLAIIETEYMSPKQSRLAN